jgi:hypothetical protein
VTAALIDWWRRRRWTKPRIGQIVVSESEDGVPEALDRHVLYLVGAADAPKWAMMECPCGRGHRLELNLSPASAPRWAVSEEDGRPTIRPSVDSHGPYHCHFWLRHGRVRWTPDAR